MSQIILHLDMNSYFASCEQQANPHLRRRPVGVCEHLGGIIIAPSVEAKRLGIKLGTTVWDAQKIYPKIVLLPVDPDKIRSITERFLRILQDYTDKVDKYSIDEAFADITEVCEGAWDNALLIGLEIKQRLRLEIGEWVSCSIGVGPNKLVAKIAADLGEGDIDRIFVVRPEEIDHLYARLNLTDVPGIGPRLERALHKLGIFSLSQLRDYSLMNLINQFGINGYFLHELARFNSPSLNPSHKGREINEGSSSPLVGEGRWGEDVIKSFGHSYTLPRPINKLNDIKKLMLKLSEKIGRRIRAKGARGNVIHYFHSDKQYEGFSKQRKIKELINDGRDIYRAAWMIFSQSCHSESALADEESRSFRLRLQDDKAAGIKIMGISVSGLKFDRPPEPLFEQYKKPWWMVEAMDKINNKYGEFTIHRGRLLGIPDEWGKDTVGFGRMKG